MKYRGKKRGVCEITLFNQDVLKVSFKRGIASGRGILHFKNGSAIHGIWKKNKLKKEESGLSFKLSNEEEQ